MLCNTYVHIFLHYIKTQRKKRWIINHQILCLPCGQNMVESNEKLSYKNNILMYFDSFMLRLMRASKEKTFKKHMFCVLHNNTYYIGLHPLPEIWFYYKVEFGLAGARHMWHSTQMSGMSPRQAACMVDQVWWNVICNYGRPSVMECDMQLW